MNKKAAIERQQIVTWYTPEEKIPPEDQTIAVTFSGKTPDGMIYDHDLATAEYWDEEWHIRGLTIAANERMTVHAWCDLEVYGA